MNIVDLGVLFAAGLGGGFIAGVLGVGGGIIFTPVLYFYFQQVGIAASQVTPLTLGSSLVCTFLAAVSSSFFHYRRGAVQWKVAIPTAVFSLGAIFLVTRFITTQAWYGKGVFQVIFSLILAVVAVHMFSTGNAFQEESVTSDGFSSRWTTLFGIGTAVGIVSPGAGIGGGVVLVPGYFRLTKLPMRNAVGTSSATIALVSLCSVFTYMLVGEPVVQTPTAIGYVDFGHASLLALPAVAAARLGVQTSHDIPSTFLRIGFAVFAAMVAGYLLWDGLL